MVVIYTLRGTPAEIFLEPCGPDACIILSIQLPLRRGFGKYLLGRRSRLSSRIGTASECAIASRSSIPGRAT